MKCRGDWREEEFDAASVEVGFGSKAETKGVEGLAHRTVLGGAVDDTFEKVDGYCSEVPDCWCVKFIIDDAHVLEGGLCLLEVEAAHDGPYDSFFLGACNSHDVRSTPHQAWEHLGSGPCPR